MLSLIVSAILPLQTKRNFSKMEEELISERNDLKKQLQNIKTTITREKEVVSATADFIKTAKEEVLIKLELASRHTGQKREKREKRQRKLILKDFWKCAICLHDQKLIKSSCESARR